jgi:hypothetical protein
LQVSALAVAESASAHCAGVGTDKVIFDHFLKPAIARSGVRFRLKIQVKYSVVLKQHIIALV